MIAGKCLYVVVPLEQIITVPPRLLLDVIPLQNVVNATRQTDSNGQKHAHKCLPFGSLGVTFGKYDGTEGTVVFGLGGLGITLA